MRDFRINYGFQSLFEIDHVYAILVKRHSTPSPIIIPQFSKVFSTLRQTGQKYTIPESLLKTNTGKPPSRAQTDFSRTPFFIIHL